MDKEQTSENKIWKDLMGGKPFAVRGEETIFRENDSFWITVSNKKESITRRQARAYVKIIADELRRGADALKGKQNA